MYSEKLYQKALQHYSEEAEVNIENEFVRKYASELCYCYVHGKELIDFDFWTRYEELLGEKLSYQEYLAIDREFDLDPHDVTPEDKEILADWKKGWQKSLDEFREEQKIVGKVSLHSIEITSEGGDGFYEFQKTDYSLDEQTTQEAFKNRCLRNSHIKENGVLREGPGYMESEYVDGKGFARLQIRKNEVPFSKAQLREFLKGIDVEILKEVLPEAVREDPLMAFIGQEVPYRMEVENGLALTDKMKKELIECVQNDVEIFIDYDKFDRNLKNMYEDLMKENLSTYETAIDYLCELLNKEEEGEFGRTPDQFQVIFESENYIGVYSFNGDNEYYLLDKENGKYDLLLGDSPDFVGRYTLGKMESQKDLHIENIEIFGWLTEYSRENVDGFIPENELGGLKGMEEALRVARVTVPFRNALELLEQQYTGTEEFRIWAERSQENTANALFHALVLLNDQYGGNEDFVSWAEKELGVSKETMSLIGFLPEKEAFSSLASQVADAKEEIAVNQNSHSNMRIGKDSKEPER